MSIWVSWFVVDFINNIMLSIYTLKDNKNKNTKFYIKYFLIILVITTITNFLIGNSPQMAKTIIKLLLLSFLLTKIDTNSFSKNLMQVFLISAIFMILDCLFGFIYAGVFKLSPQDFQNNVIAIIIVNFIMAGLTYILLLCKKLDKFIRNMASLYSSKDTVNLVGNVVLCIFSLWFFMKRTTVDDVPIYEHIMNFAVIIAITGFVIGFFKEKSDKKRMGKEYDQLLDYAKTYEREVVEKSKWQHEYQNQLIIVKSKISKHNKEAQEYIDELLKNQPIDENSQWLGKLSNFPNIGIKGLLCYKIGQMHLKGIKVYVDVTGDLKIGKKQNELLEKNLQDISRVLGVYLDNAIEASTSSISKYLILEVEYTKNQMIFQISNTYCGNLDLQRVDEEKFTTKGKGRGYGLSLAKDILKKNSLLSQEREINGMYYVQKLIIDIKK